MYPYLEIQVNYVCVGPKDEWNIPTQNNEPDLQTNDTSLTGSCFYAVLVVFWWY